MAALRCALSRSCGARKKIQSRCRISRQETTGAPRIAGNDMARDEGTMSPVVGTDNGSILCKSEEETQRMAEMYLKRAAQAVRRLKFTGAFIAQTDLLEMRVNDASFGPDGIVETSTEVLQGFQELLLANFTKRSDCQTTQLMRTSCLGRTLRSVSPRPHDIMMMPLTNRAHPSSQVRSYLTDGFRRFSLEAYSSTGEKNLDLPRSSEVAKVPNSGENLLQPIGGVSVEEAERLFFDEYHRLSGASKAKTNSLSKDNFNSQVAVILDGYKNSPHRAEAFLDKIHQIDHEGNPKVTVHRTLINECYQLVVKSWIEIDPPCPDRAERLLSRMLQMGLRTGAGSLNLALKGWEMAGDSHRAQSLLERLSHFADWESYARVLHSWAKLGKSHLAPLKANHLIAKMEENLGENERSSVCYMFALECWAASNRVKSVENCEPLMDKLRKLLRVQNKVEAERLATFGMSLNDAIFRSTASLLRVYSKADNAHVAEDILLEFTNDYSLGRHDVPPTLDMMGLVLSAWTRSKSSRRAARAERLLMRLEKEAEDSKNSPRALPFPDIMCYSLALHACAKSGKTDAGARAESILQRMPMKPNVRSYTSVLTAWSRSDNENDSAVDGAERVWSNLVAACDGQESKDRPDDWAISTMITVWGRSMRKDAIDRAEAYFSLIQRPSAIESRTALIQAWARQAPRRGLEAVERSETLLRQSSERPNSRTVAAVLQTIERAQGVDDRGKRAERILALAEELGCKITPHISSIARRCHGRVKNKKKVQKKHKHTNDKS